MVSDAHRNFLVRSISAVLLIPVVLYVILSSLYIFYASIGLIAVLMGMEWRGMIKKLKSKLIWSVVALIYIFVFVFSLCWIRSVEDGQSFLIWLLVTTWMADTGAFAFGKIIGGPKLVPKISPSKTWAGLLGAIIFSGVTGVIFKKFFNFGSGEMFVYITISLGIAAQVGDLFESWIKRKAKIKDSGKTIPGHGGILDRVDGLVLSSFCLMIMLVFCKKLLS
jgi:phosphatidate cytidylyltransferase